MARETMRTFIVNEQIENWGDEPLWLLIESALKLSSLSQSKEKSIKVTIQYTESPYYIVTLDRVYCDYAFGQAYFTYFDTPPYNVPTGEYVILSVEIGDGGCR